MYLINLHPLLPDLSFKNAPRFSKYLLIAQGRNKGVPHKCHMEFTNYSEFHNNFHLYRCDKKFGRTQIGLKITIIDRAPGSRKRSE